MHWPPPLKVKVKVSPGVKVAPQPMVAPLRCHDTELVEVTADAPIMMLPCDSERVQLNLDGYANAIDASHICGR